MVAVTGYEEAGEVYRDTATFSSCNSVIGPFATFPVPLEGDDVSDIIDRHRDQLPMNEHMVTMDPPDHTRERALVMRLITSKRLQENEAFMCRLADNQLDEFIADGQCEFITAYLPALRHAGRRRPAGRARRGPPAVPARVRPEPGPRRTRAPAKRDQVGLNALAWLDEWFAEYIEDRGGHPRRDVLTDLALATYPDGSMPDVTSVVRTATFLFAAGQETTARLLAVALKYLCRVPGAPGRASGRNGTASRDSSRRPCGSRAR